MVWLLANNDLQPFVATALTGYAAIIASFLGGIHWGAAWVHSEAGSSHRDEHQVPALWWGITASLLAWLGVLIPIPTCLVWYLAQGSSTSPRSSCRPGRADLASACCWSPATWSTASSTRAPACSTGSRCASSSRPWQRCPASWPPVRSEMKAAIRYRVSVLDPRQHLYGVTLEIDNPAARQRLEPAGLDSWRLSGARVLAAPAEPGKHRRPARALVQLDKNSWEARLPAGSRKSTLQLSYEVYAFDPSVRTAFLDRQRGFFNPTSLCLRRASSASARAPTGADRQRAHRRVASRTGCARPRRCAGFGRYQAGDYDELADCPFELGRFWSGSFEVHGVPHRLVVSGAGDFADYEQLLRDTQRICETEIAFWHPDGGQPPFGHYLFMLHATQDGYGGLEHRNSTALVCQRSDRLAAPRRPKPGKRRAKASDGYTTLLGLISHEYFHTWNVKRLRPREFRRYDYDRENYTELLWFFEGFTSYYDDPAAARRTDRRGSLT